MHERSNAVMRQPAGAADRALRTPRAAAVAGIVFAVLFALSIGLMRLAIPEGIAGPGGTAWLQNGGGGVSLALTLVPFAGIAFLWFVGVIRNRLGRMEDQFFSTVFYGSGLLFLASELVHPLRELRALSQRAGCEVLELPLHLGADRGGSL